MPGFFKVSYSKVVIIASLALITFAFLNLPKSNRPTPGVIVIPSKVTKLTLNLNDKRPFKPDLGEINLRSLDIVGPTDSSSVDFQNLFTEIEKLDKLTSLGLVGFKALPDRFWTLKNLVKIENLRLDSDNLAQIPSQIYTLPNLKELSLGDNSIVTLPEKSEKTFRYLNFSGNKLKEFPIDFVKSAQVSLLDLSRNQLTTVPHTIKELQDLTTLNLSDNPLVSLPVELRDMPNLKDLKLINVKVTVPERPKTP